MKRSDTGEIFSDERIIEEEMRKDDLVRKVMDNMRYNYLDDKIAGFGYGIRGWELHFYGDAVEEAIEIANELIGTNISTIFENVIFKDQSRERPVIGGIEIVTEGNCWATIGWVANKRDSSSRGIVTVEHAVVVNGWIANNTSSVSDRIAVTESAFNNSFIDASYSPFNSGIDGSPSIKNLGNVVAWMGYNSVYTGMSISFNGYGSGGRVNTQVINKGYYGEKYRQVVIEPVTTGGDSGAAYANYNSDTGCWVLIGLHRTREYLSGGTQLRSIGSCAEDVNDYTVTYPYLV
jgi:hypothetical protein